MSVAPAVSVAPVPVSMPVAVLLLALLAVAAPLDAAGQREEEAQLRRLEVLDELSLAGSSFDVAIAAVVAPVDPELSSTTASRLQPSSYARILRDLVTGPGTRYLNVEDRFRLATRRLEREQRAVERARDERRRALERQALRQGGTVPDDDPQLRELDERRQLLASIRPEEVVVPAELPLRVLDAEPRFRAALFDPAGLARRHPDAELILWLELEPLGDLQLMTLRAWERSSDTTTEVLRAAGRPEELGALIEGGERAIVAALAGQPLGILDVDLAGSGDADADGAAAATGPGAGQGAPPDGGPTARAFLDGRYLGVLPLVAPYELPGTYEVRVELDDGRELSRQVVVQPAAATRIRLPVVGPEPERVTIDSEPSGARVYRGSLWVGFTPVSVPRPRDTVPYTLVREGYYDSRVTLDEDAPAQIRSTLVSRDTDWPAEVRSARNRFYRAFGAFALSVGVPVLVNGVYQNYNGLLDSSGSGSFDSSLTAAEQDRLLMQTNALFVGYYASLGLSAGLFGNMVWRLVDYVQTAQGYHTR